MVYFILNINLLSRTNSTNFAYDDQKTVTSSKIYIQNSQTIFLTLTFEYKRSCICKQNEESTNNNIVTKTR